MPSTFRMTYPTAMVLQALAAGHRYGFEIADVVGLRPGSVYQVLRRLEDRGFVEGAWEDADRAHAEGRPPRRYYELDPVRSRPELERARSRFPTLDAVPDTGSGASGGSPA
ncbi:MAG TPA: helix-turn-helix transcriptional regulator [Longimicrobiales bacterium]|nr:helix-turn-helix transcriptional regulator [Longimicrobiales bacterium]